MIQVSRQGRFLHQIRFQKEAKRGPGVWKTGNGMEKGGGGAEVYKPCPETNHSHVEFFQRKKIESKETVESFPWYR